MSPKTSSNLTLTKDQQRRAYGATNFRESWSTDDATRANVMLKPECRLREFELDLASNWTIQDLVDFDNGTLTDNVALAAGWTTADLSHFDIIDTTTDKDGNVRKLALRLRGGGKCTSRKRNTVAGRTRGSYEGRPRHVSLHSQ